MQSVSSWASWAPKVVRKCESKHWFSCGADGRRADGRRAGGRAGGREGGRSVYGHVITKFSGMGRLYSYGAPSTRALRAREELRYYYIRFKGF